MIKVGSCANPWGVYRAWRNDQIPWERYLNEFAQSGFHFMEGHPYGYTPTDAAILKDECDRRQIIPISSMLLFPLDDNENLRWAKEQTRRICRLMSDIGGEYIIFMDGSYRNTVTRELIRDPEMDDSTWKCFTDNLTTLSKIAWEEYGIKGVLHPHSDQRVEYTRQILRLFDMTDPKYVNICFDTGHHALRNDDVYEFLEKYIDRITYIHLKNINQEIADRYNKENLELTQIVNMGVFTLLEEGSIDFVKIRDILRKKNWSGYVLLERDSHPKTEEEYSMLLPLAIKDREYLERIDMGIFQ